MDDVLTTLKKKKEFYLEEVSKINKAIAVITKKDTAVSPRRVKWGDVVMEVFEDQDKEVLYSLAYVRQELASRGYPEALDEKKKAAIFDALKRLVARGILGKDGSSRYYLYQKRSDDV